MEQIRPFFHELNNMQKYGRKDFFIFYKTQFTVRKSDDRQLSHMQISNRSAMLKRHFCYPHWRFSSLFCKKTKSFRYVFYFVILLISTSTVTYQKLKNFHRTVFLIFTKFMKNASAISERFTRRSGHTEQIRLIYHESNTTYKIWPER